MRSVALFIVFLFVSGVISIAQTSESDSLLKVLKTSDDKSKITILNRLAWLSLQTNLEQSEEYSNQVLALAKDASEEKALAYHNIGLVYYFRGDPEKAINYYSKSIDINEKLNNYAQLVKTYNNLGAIYNEIGDNQKSINYFLQSLNFSRQIGDSTGVARALGNISNVHISKGEYAQAVKLNEQALKLKLILGDKSGAAITLVNLGIALKNLGDYTNALKMYFDALAIHENSGSVKDQGITLHAIATVYLDWKEYEQSKIYLKQALKKLKESNHKQGQGYSYNLLANIEMFNMNYDSASYYLQQALDLLTEINDATGTANTYTDLAKLNLKRKNYRQSLYYVNKAKEKYEEIGDKKGFAISYNLSAEVKDSLGNYNEALEDAFKALEFSKEMNNKSLIAQSYNNISNLYTRISDYRKALYYYNLFFLLNDSLFNEQKSKQIAELNTLYDTRKKESEIALQKAEIEMKNVELERKNLLSQSLIGGIVALLAIIGLGIYAYHQIIKKNVEIESKNDQLAQRNEEIESQRDQILVQHTQITDSVTYAERIQSSLLPPDDFIKDKLKNFFVLYHPMNVVSGDFYWVKSFENHTVVAVADCTGHGIPGAFMSILGISLLNEIVNELTIDSSELLFAMREKLKSALRQSSNPGNARDGMDMALCVVNRKKKQIQYSGAFLPLLVIKEKRIIEYEGDKMPIGVFFKEKDAFTRHEIDIDGSESVYMFSDGFADQFGGPNHQKFKYQNLKEVLLRINSLEMNEQKEELDKTFLEWKGNNPQTDDLLVFGFKTINFI